MLNGREMEPMFKGSVQESRSGGRGELTRGSDMGFRIVGTAIALVIGRLRGLLSACFQVQELANGVWPAPIHLP
jgi:hypothetical protein